MDSLADTTDEVGLIMAYESGELGTDGILRLFSRLIASGRAWSLQGAYGRAAHSLIASGWIEAGTGRILRTPSGEE